MLKDTKILYEDNHIIAVFKPAGLLVQPASPKTASRGGGDSSGDKSLMDEIKTYLKEKYNKPGKVFLGLVHRLDRNVSGIVLFGKTSKGAARLSEQFRNNEVKKTYHAVVEGEIRPASGTLIHYLKKDEVKKIALVSDSPKRDFDRSELSYNTLSSTLNYSLLTINLLTGRFHQIRAQLSAIGHPIAGDVKYGAKSVKSGLILLSATEIDFRTATAEEYKKITIGYPKEWEKLLRNKNLVGY